ncbi:hypothetical protein [uncultured Desulfovibrio sp.]|uniref:hypothetical protein n=1 Tax=uncultured Desulfovibrio sp. TaxID=167968 RepID=UPI002868B566|nr:hypothetical protein [uncultured Desulfovibrio sp.]
MDNTITGFVHLDKIADEIGDEAGTCDADYAFQRAAAQMIYDLRNALEQAKARAEQAEADVKEWKEQIPEECPITGLPYFNSFKNSAGVYQPFYGGPYDVYGIPYKDEDGYLCRKHLCLDSMREEDENMCLEVVEEERMIDLGEAEARAERAESAQLHLCQWLSDIAVELGCACDNEAMLLAVHEIKARAEKAEAENARLRERLEAALDKIAEIQENDNWEKADGVCYACGICSGIPDEWQPTDDHCCREILDLWSSGEPLPWEAARQAVAAGEE